jgi:hypothetical protein
MKTKQIELNTNDIPNITDVLCICEPHSSKGAVTVLANARGRDCLQKVFPAWGIPWETDSKMPSDWLHAAFYVPEMASRGGHHLPPITGGIPLEEAAPAALAFLLAIAAKEQGARAMTWDDQQEVPFTLYPPPQN